MSMAFANNGIDTLKGGVGTSKMDTLKGKDDIARMESSPQIEINKRMAMGNNIMDRFRDFFLENEEDSTPPLAPTPQQCCNNPMMTPVDDRIRMCQHCGAEEVYQPFEHAQGEVPLTCSASLKRKKGRFCKGKPLIDGL